MKNKYLDIWVFLLSYVIMIVGILFFIGFSIAFDFIFADIILLIMMGWVTVHSFIIIINIFVNNIRKYLVERRSEGEEQ